MLEGNAYVGVVCWVRAIASFQVDLMTGIWIFQLFLCASKHNLEYAIYTPESHTSKQYLSTELADNHIVELDGACQWW